MRHVLSDRRYGFSVYPTIVLLTGAYTNNACWPQPFVHRLVDNGFHVLALDHRDFGRNAWTGAQYTLDDMADDVLYTLRAHRIRSAHIFGASMGGSIAMRMALIAPERCASLSLLSTTPGRFWQEEMLPPPSDNAKRAMRTELRLATEGDPLAALAARTDAFGDDASLHSAIVSRGYNTKSGHGGACQSAEALLPRLPHINVPTLIVHGEDDEVFPVEHAWALHDALPHSKLKLLRDVNHRFPHEYSTTVADAVTSHARENR